MNATSKLGFEYTVQHIRAGKIIGETVERNVVPTEGLNHILNVIFKGSSAVANWYIGLYETAYTPSGADTAAAIAAASTETTAYTGTTRLAFTPGTVAAGAVDNADNKAEFTFNATKTIYGGFIISSSVRNGTAGVLISAVRFGSPKSVVSGDILRIFAGITTVSVD